jgi:hypothetical protein
MNEGLDRVLGTDAEHAAWKLALDLRIERRRWGPNPLFPCEIDGYQPVDFDDAHWHAAGHYEAAMACGRCERLHDGTMSPEYNLAACIERADHLADLEEIRAADKKIAATVPWLPGAPEAYRYR